MRDFDLRALQLRELKMLKDFAKFCDENNIVYYLDAGTLLGAARHQGFIPWDDDIDVCMDVKNYRKFLKIAPRKFPKPYFVQNYRTDHKVNVRWSRIRIDGTTSMERNMTGYHIHYGICMDVFVMAGIANTSIGKKVQNLANFILSIYLEKYSSRWASYKISGKIKILCKYTPEFLRLGICRLVERVLLLDTQKKKSCYNTWYQSPSDKGTICFPSQMYTPESRVKITFEDGQFYAPVEWKKYLSMQYGDWEQLPPEEERVNHGDIIVDLEHDYSTYYTYEQ